jgi:uncharacterized protein (DUF2267 family)
MDYDAFVETVEDEAAEPRDRAERAVRATLETLGERLSGGEARDVAGRLPAELRPLLHDGDNVQAFDAEEFIRRVAEREGAPPATAARHARAVFAALGRAIGHEELQDMASELPRDFSGLLEAASSRAAEPEGRATSATLSADAFWTRVAERAGLERERAVAATDAVLEALADRISGGEVDDLEQQLPRELHPPLERGRAQSNAAARPLGLDEFVRGIAEREGVTPDEAREHARAVFATLRETLTDKEFSDVAAQLPADYAALLARP